MIVFHYLEKKKKKVGGLHNIIETKIADGLAWISFSIFSSLLSFFFFHTFYLPSPLSLFLIGIYFTEFLMLFNKLLDTVGTREKKSIAGSVIWRRKWWVWPGEVKEESMNVRLTPCLLWLTGIFHFKASDSALSPPTLN